ncbi:hypothetical protein [Spiroplasma floricola]|uniref:Uncharacterized protein n=1 Tax=Spiroplasma floricola 23-6 TaxID=1336749 RepID=A0A2K8SD62_9MOLU|nr:hypothetical protein [Spiroplasma floricola]AUB31407.1 hypothetical protein SFLOR_v1c03500 [Spiroplasma floricola 23-6]
MKDIFKILDELLKNIIPVEIKYVFKEKYETDQKYEFILLIEKRDSILFKDKKTENLAESITNICNSQASTFSKKIAIDLEVLESYA